jgi:hypothetical protein
MPFFYLRHFAVIFRKHPLLSLTNQFQIFKTKGRCYKIFNHKNHSIKYAIAIYKAFWEIMYYCVILVYKYYDS